MKNLFATSFLLLALQLALIGTGAQAQAPRGQVHNEKAAILMARKIWINL
jgi:hypothetical protein